MSLRHIYGCGLFFSAPRTKSEQEIKKEIASMIRQITASVSFLPLLESACTLNASVSSLTIGFLVNALRIHVIISRCFSWLIVVGKCVNSFVTGAFDILVYTDKDLNVPQEWGESGACMIDNSQEVKLRSFSTTIHKVDSMVAYKNT